MAEDTPSAGISRGTLDDLAAAAADHLFYSLFDAAPDAMVVVDDAHEIVFVNTQTESLFGYQRQELVGQSVDVLVPKRLREQHASHRAEYARDMQSRPMGVGMELFGLRKNGTEFPVDISLSPVNNGGASLVSALIRDVTGRKRTEEEAARLRAVVESSEDAIVGKDLDGVIRAWNVGAERLYGYGAAEALGKSAAMLVAPEASNRWAELTRRVAAGEHVDHEEAVFLHKDGTEVNVSLTMSPIRDSAGKLTGVSTIARDITDRLSYGEQLRQLAENDGLTGLRGRRGFERDLADQVGRSRSTGELATLLVVDLNGFKLVNEMYGYRGGDKVLKAVASVLQKRLRDNDVVARVGDDEFAVLLAYIGVEQGTAVAADVRRLIGECRFELGGQKDVHITASVGVVQIDDKTPSDEAALGEAGRMLQIDKSENRSGA